MNRFALASSVSGTVASAVGGTLRSLGLDAADYDKQLEEARKTLLQSIGVGARSRMDEYAPDFSAWPQFDMSLAIQLAEYAFDSYNSPAGGRWVLHPDGARTSYLSADLIKTLYSGVLMIEVQQPKVIADDTAARAFMVTGACRGCLLVLSVFVCVLRGVLMIEVQQPKVIADDTAARAFMVTGACRGCLLVYHM
jgi:hypothetical protein